jgi:hypothetical protein
MTPLASLALLLAASPALMFAAHAVAHRALDRAAAKPTAHSSAFVALIAAFVLVVAAAWWLGAFAQGGLFTRLCTFAYVMIVYGALGILYLDVVNIAETSLHMHLLLELAWSGSVPAVELFDRYSADRMIAARLERLTSIGQLRIENDRCFVADRSALRLARVLDLWRVVIRLPIGPPPDALDALPVPGPGGQ